MLAPARQMELAPAPRGEGGCCPDPSSAAEEQKVSRLRCNKNRDDERKGLCGKG